MKTFFLENTCILEEKTKTFLPQVIFITAHTAFHSAHTNQALRGNVGWDPGKSRSQNSETFTLIYNPDPGINFFKFRDFKEYTLSMNAKGYDFA